MLTPIATVNKLSCVLPTSHIHTLHTQGEEEIRLKKKRDISYQKCLDYKQKLKSSREALQQLSELSKTSNPYTVTDAISKSA